jgi:hypothetical protein
VAVPEEFYENFEAGIEQADKIKLVGFWHIPAQARAHQWAYNPLRGSIPKAAFTPRLVV